MADQRLVCLTQRASVKRISYFHEMLVKHIDLVERRLVFEETIAHEEKAFSLFEPHTELRNPIRRTVSSSEADNIENILATEIDAGEGDLIWRRNCSRRFLF